MSLSCDFVVVVFCFQAEDGIRDLVRSRGLGDVYKRQVLFGCANRRERQVPGHVWEWRRLELFLPGVQHRYCLLYTSDAADERSSVDLGGRRIIKKKKRHSDRE